MKDSFWEDILKVNPKQMLSKEGTRDLFVRGFGEYLADGVEKQIAGMCEFCTCIASDDGDVTGAYLSCVRCEIRSTEIQVLFSLFLFSICTFYFMCSRSEFYRYGSTILQFLTDHEKLKLSCPNRHETNILYGMVCYILILKSNTIEFAQHYKKMQEIFPST